METQKKLISVPPPQIYPTKVFYTFSNYYMHLTRIERGKGLSCTFMKIGRKCLDFGRNCPDFGQI